MTEPGLIQRERELLESLARLVSDQAETSRRAAAELAAAAAIEAEARQQRAAMVARHQQEQQQARADVEASRQAIDDRAQAAKSAGERELHGSWESLEEQREAEESKVTAARDDALFETAAVYEAAKNALAAQWKQIEQRAAGMHEAVQARWALAAEILGAFPSKMVERLRQLVVEAPSVTAAQTFEACLQQSDERLAELKGLVLPKLFRAGPLTALAGAAALLLVYPSGWVTGWRLGWWIGLDVLLLGGVAAALVTVYSSASARTCSVYIPLCEALLSAAAARKQWQKAATASHRAQREANRARRSEEKARARQNWQQRLKEARGRHERLLREAEERHAAAAAETARRRQSELAAAEERFARRQGDAGQRRDDELREIEGKYERERAANQQRVEAARAAVAQRWRQGAATALDLERGIALAAAALMPPWQDRAWHDWAPPLQASPVLRLGSLEVEPGPDAGRHLKPLVLPALVAFPQQASILIEAEAEGRKPAAELLATVMLRMLCGMPPGKVRFTLIDPVGLGQSFAAFMHLADYHEALVGSRIWTEPAHIEQRLADLTGQVETIIQKYLRNEYESLDAYNAQAGELAEPLRVLVIADYPANFSEQAARRLTSLVSMGARCGVHTLIARDTAQRLPPGSDLAELARQSTVLRWNGQGFTWQNATFGQHRLIADRLPPSKQLTQIVRKVGEAALGSRRVVVPFERIAPPPDRWWKGDSREGIQVALGMAGAHKQHSLRLGKGTAQHVLLAGKTGSGKSTLWHALITNLALTYSPAELELYLVDFKKGVEFKTYAAHALRHARVVAIESDREFGLSVLERLDGELRQRGEWFREAGVQDLAGWRRATGRGLPRALLIVDEFQEFFVEDDRLAQDAALLLDRLVRQGRAFGIHVLLGSQTLGGAYSLARSTIGQMAVRIALASSEADAHLVLGEDNTAARLLSRPGEAIYNDASGLVEANHPFQVAWLDDQRRDGYLARVAELAGPSGEADQAPMVVFEGNAPADIRDNAVLVELAAAPDEPEQSGPAMAWLGEPVAIKEPTAAVFSRQSGRNLLVVGQNERMAEGIMQAALVSLSAWHPAAASEAKFFVLEGGSSPGHLGMVPTAVRLREGRVGGWRQAAAILGEVAAEVERRRQPDASQSAAWYLAIHDLQRFAELRRREDDFGLSRGEAAAASPHEQLATIVREGPLVGVHVLVWSDSLGTAQRAFDRQTLREFEMRVLLQMSAADSTSLIDTPAASRLGPQRALFHSEEQNRVEKFRPYQKVVMPEDYEDYEPKAVTTTE